jgi:hypothetical protein
VYDIIAPASFASATLARPSFVFLLDLSRRAIESGITLQCIATIEATLPSLSDSVYVGLMTMSTVITVYDFRRRVEYVVADFADPALPRSPLSPLGGCRDVLSEVLKKLTARAGEFLGEGHCLASALLVVQHAMLRNGGVVVACIAGPPKVGQLALPLHLPVGKDGKPDLTLPRAFRELANRLNTHRVSVHLFATDPCNLSVLGPVAGMTGGSVHFYPAFDAAALHTDLFATLTAEYFWDASMRMRASMGVKPGGVFAICGIREHALFFPVMTHRSSVAFEIQVTTETALPPVALFQCAMLWTDSERRRKIRVFTFSVPTTDQPLLVRAAVNEAAVTALWVNRFAPTNGDIRGMAEGFRKAFSAMVSGGHPYKSLYHLAHGYLASAVLRPSAPYGLDWEIAEAFRVRGLSVFDSILLSYPRFIVVDSSDDPEPAPLVGESFQLGFIVVVHSSNRIFVWANPQTPLETKLAYFGAEELPPEIPQIETAENRRLNAVISKCYELSGAYLPTEIIPAESPREAVFRELLVDISTEGGTDLPGFLRQMPTFY